MNRAPTDISSLVGENRYVRMSAEGSNPIANFSAPSAVNARVDDHSSVLKSSDA